MGAKREFFSPPPPPLKRTHLISCDTHSKQSCKYDRVNRVYNFNRVTDESKSKRDNINESIYTIQDNVAYLIYKRSCILHHIIWMQYDDCIQIRDSISLYC